MNIKLINDKVDKFICDSIDIVGSGGISILATMVSDVMIGQIAPGFVSTLIAYKQKRLERNMDKLLEELLKHQKKIDDLIGKININIMEIITRDIFPLLYDYSAEEKQVEKIKYIVNGFESVVEIQLNDQDLILSYYDTLAELNLADIKFIKKIAQASIPQKVESLVIPTKIVNVYQAFERQILNKLVQMGIVKIANSIYDVDGRNEMHDLKSIKYTSYGKHFIDFIKI